MFRHPLVADQPRPSAYPTKATGCALGLLALLTGCGTPPELSGPPTPRVSRSLAQVPILSASPLRPAPGLPSALPSETGFSESQLVPCGGSPSRAQIAALVRRSTEAGSVTVSAGPFCAGTWQFTTVTAPGREPLQVVSRGRPGALTLVTAGTDVCSVPVRVGAPVAIRTVACESAPLPSATPG